MEKYGIDYDETYAHVVRFETLTFVLLLVGLLRLKREQFDFVTAFLNARTNMPIYTEQPEGFVIERLEDYVCLLLKSVYGLKQAPRDWNCMLHEFLVQLRFKRSYKDCGLYCYRKGVLVFVTVYVDDLLIIGKEEHTQCVAALLKRAFNIKEVGGVRYLLGIEIGGKDSDDCITFSQRNFVEGILKTSRWRAQIMCAYS